ncbi:S-layer homology domain-containing protein [Solibacillus sp. MA9]|uniref:S-layer homology domain-containing protein n=1 Tax=Solibacillus palustris TaxID=2908203 RepID=A0ABS9U8G9_9BACL|nr:S-layer homology domain-containing protein [Solibacillus sp. MA9]
MIKKIFSFGITLLLIMSFSILSPSFANANDIDNHPMVHELTYWSNLNVIRPDANGNYNPNRAVTRGEFASYITRALNLPESSTHTFKDLKAGQTLTNEIQAAAGAGILSGYPDGTFRPNDKITREQMSALLLRTLTYGKVPLNGAPLTFKDNDKIRNEFKPAVATNVYYNIIRGSQTAKGIYFEPKGSATIAQAAAFLYRMQTVIDQYSENSEEPPVTPPVDASNYYIGKINNGVVTKNPTSYYSYEQAVEAQKAANLNLIFKGEKIINMPAGIASAADTTANTVTIYSDPNFKTVLTGAVEGSEFKYYASTDKYAIVRLADTKGYAKMDEITLTPSSLVNDKSSYYSVVDGILHHNTYNHITKKYYGAYTIGPAPSFMKPNVHYYSQDGVNFYSDFLLTAKVGTYYPYFQFASIRQHTNYTAEELDNIIMTLLTERQVLAGYENVLTDSRLIGLGTLLKEVEATYNINALFILAAAIHESNYGISENALKKNNIFGIKVYDSNTALGTTFASRDDSVRAFINQYTNLNYVPQSGGYAKGAAPGNKTSGMNVHYASDPFWGSKIAGHMYRIDNRFGKKDSQTSQLGFVVNNGDLVNTRAEATTDSEKVFTYKAKNVGETKTFGYPVVIVEETQAADGYVWYKIISDANPPSRYVWVRSDLVTKFQAN